MHVICMHSCPGAVCVCVHNISSACMQDHSLASLAELEPASGEDDLLQWTWWVGESAADPLILEMSTLSSATSVSVQLAGMQALLKTPAFEHAAKAVSAFYAALAKCGRSLACVGAAQKLPGDLSTVRSQLSDGADSAPSRSLSLRCELLVIGYGNQDQRAVVRMTRHMNDQSVSVGTAASKRKQVASAPPHKVVGAMEEVWKWQPYQAAVGRLVLSDLHVQHSSDAQEGANVRLHGMLLSDRRSMKRNYRSIISRRDRVRTDSADQAGYRPPPPQRLPMLEAATCQTGTVTYAFSCAQGTDVLEQLSALQSMWTDCC